MISFFLQEEILLATWIKAMAKKGMPVEARQVVASVEAIVKSDGRATTFKDYKPGRKWLELFLKRHPDLSLRKPEAVGIARSLVTERAIRNWHGNLKQYIIDETGDATLLDDPKRILNADESGFQTNPGTSLVLGPKGFKDLYEIKGNEKECITVLAAFSANGDMAPPCIVYPFERIPAEISRLINPEWSVGKSKSGWMTAQVFYGYVANTLIPFLKEKKTKFPVLFLVDGHKSHINFELAQLCQGNGIILYALLPNATHILQPADVALFRPIKCSWRKIVADWKQQTGNRTVTRANFAPLLDMAFCAVSSEILKKGFVKCGLYPFNADAIDYQKCLSDSIRIVDKPMAFKTEELLHFESLLPRKRVEEFRTSGEEWQGAETAKELFVAWKKMKKLVQFANPSRPTSSRSTTEPSVAPEDLTEQSGPNVAPEDLADLSFPSYSASPPMAVTPVPVTTSTAQEISPAFAEAILWPSESPVKKNQGKARKRIKLPDAIGAGEWQKYWQEKDDEKLKKEERKIERLKKREEKVLAAAKRKSDQISSSEEEDEVHMDDGHTSDEVEWDAPRTPTPTWSEDEDYGVGHFVIVKFSLKKRNRIFVGVIEGGDEANDWRIKFLRRERKTAYFVYPNVPDVQMISNNDVMCRVPLKEAGSTARCANKLVIQRKYLEKYPDLE